MGRNRRVCLCDRGSKDKLLPLFYRGLWAAGILLYVSILLLVFMMGFLMELMWQLIRMGLLGFSLFWVRSIVAIMIPAS